ncbi:MAG: hypothetical protein ACRDK8_04925 [Solirubrobacteraceae bacterium]
MIDPHFVFLGMALSLAGSAGYCRAMIQGRARPNRVTWALWALAPLVAFAAELSEGVGLPSVLTLSVGVGPLGVFLCSFAVRTGRWRIGPVDIACGVLSLCAIALWAISGRGTTAIALSIAADALAGVPTVRKAIIAPDTEHPLPYLAGMANATITLFTIRHWSFSTAGFPVYILGIATILFALARRTTHNGGRCAPPSCSARESPSS